MKAYIAGPMSTIPQYNVPAFEEAADAIRHKGHGVVSPVDLDKGSGFNLSSKDDFDSKTDWSVSAANRAWLLKRDFLALLECDIIVLLDGWENSVGSNIELLVAISAGMDVYRYHQDTGILRRTGAMPQIFHVQGHLNEVRNIQVVSL